MRYIDIFLLMQVYYDFSKRNKDKTQHDMIYSLVNNVKCSYQLLLVTHDINVSDIRIAVCDRQQSFL